MTGHITLGYRQQRLDTRSSGNDLLSLY